MRPLEWDDLDWLMREPPHHWHRVVRALGLPTPPRAPTVAPRVVRRLTYPAA